MKTSKMLLVGVFTLLAGLAACGGGGSSAPAGNRYGGSSAPGDAWTWTIWPTIFTANNTTLNNQYDGTKMDLASGFLRLLVTSSTDSDDVGNVPYVAYGIEFPETLLIAQRATDAAASVLAGIGACSTVNALYNWVVIPEDGWDAATKSAYGTASTTITGNVFDFELTSYLLDGSPDGTETSDDWICANGELTRLTDPEIATISPSGVFVVDNGPNAGGAVGVKAPQSNLDIEDIVSKEYRGVLTTRTPHLTLPPPAMVDETEAIGARPPFPPINNPANTLLGFSYDSIDNNIENLPTVTVTLTDQDFPGIITGTLTDSNGTRPVVFVVNQVNGRYMLFGIATDTSPLEPYNVFLVEKI